MVELCYLSHAGFEISTKDTVIYVDPYLSDNPRAPIKPSEVKKADLILVTHDHHDHLGDSIEIAKRTGATVVSVPELSNELSGVNKLSMNIGAFVRVKGINVAMVPAFHTCLKGTPVGFIIEANGKRIYHAGDTALFSDMGLIKKIYQPKLAILPIGGHYVMGPREAAYALKLLKPEVVIPIHYRTFPVLVQDANQFVKVAKRLAPKVKVVILKPSQTFEY